jgi:hypothetical protein
MKFLRLMLILALDNCAITIVYCKCPPSLETRRLSKDLDELLRAQVYTTTIGVSQVHARDSVGINSVGSIWA